MASEPRVHQFDVVVAGGAVRDVDVRGLQDALLAGGAYIDLAGRG